MFVDKYQKETFDNVIDDLSPDAKGAEWFLQKAQWLYSMYVRDMGCIPLSSVVKFQELRLYAEAKQPTTKYMDRLMPLKRKDGKWIRKGSYNISWDILSVMPKFINKILGMYERLDVNASARCIDELSDDAKNMMKARRKIEILEKEFLSAFDELSGTGPQTEEVELPFQPENLQELDLIDKMGGFKLWEEVAMEKLVQWSYDLSDWQELKKMIIKDLVVLGRAWIKDYTDTHTQRAKIRYVDPEYFVGYETIFNDFKELTEAGEIKFFSIQQLWETGEFTKLELAQVARSFASILNNPPLTSMMGSGNYSQRQYNYDFFKSWKVAVLDFEFISFDTEVYQSVIREDGSRRNYTEKINFKDKKTDRRETIRDKTKRWYRCKWIIGTNYVYDYGYQYDVPWHNDDEPKCSFTGFRVAERSIVDMCIAPLDDLQFSVLKFRNAVAKGKPSGIKVEWGTLTNMTIGGKKMDPSDILVAYRETGDIVYRASVDSSGRPQQGISNPVEELVGGVGPYLNELFLCFDRSLNLIREQTGLSQIVDASAPTPESQVGTSKIAESSFNDILRPIWGAYTYMKRHVAMNITSRWQIVALFNPESFELNKHAIGSPMLEVLRTGADIGAPSYGIFFDAIVDDNAIIRIDTAAKESQAAGKNGAPGITLRDYFVIMRMLESGGGGIKMAELYLSYREDQEKKLIDQRALQNQKMNSEAALSLEQAKAQTLQLTEKLQKDRELAAIIEKGNQDRQTILFQLQAEKKFGKQEEEKI